MNDDQRAALRQASVPDADIDALTALDAVALDCLIEHLERAQDWQARELRAAMDGMLDAMPRLLRGPVKKLFER
ncbi:hypothetical protein [Abyssibacter profundi]|uniref:Uncharacterized protein n=1 Tax=Abyssibacter profundi TaxID=2182787 RepID=A0A363UJQ7_9GAMM|nr:hypothetical protein [Abyssibacter profundi]MBV60648.1 hypothetical protein [Nevskiales bacterium]PWN55658.1 hypothetical protein DEH80_11165 [Abyssibacter profundi]